MRSTKGWGWAAAAGLSLAATAFTYSELLTGDRIPLFRDVVLFFVPLKQFLADALREGRVALWNPYVFLGHPFLAELQTGVFYPPSLLLLFGLPLGLDLFLLFHYLLALAGVGLLVASRRLGAAATCIGVLTFVIGGFLVSMLNVMNFLQSVAWTPWILWLAARMLEEPTRLRFVALALLAALQALAGGVEVQLLTIGLAFIQGVEQLRRAPGRVAAWGASLGGALALAGMAVAFQLLPTAELVAASSRAEALELTEVAAWSLQPVSLLQLVFPQSSALLAPEEQGGMSVAFERGSTWLGTIYFGLVPLLCAAAGAATGRTRLLWIGVAVAGLLLALGIHTPVFGWVYHAAPWLVGKFRYPEKFFLLTHVAVTILAAEGAERILSGDERARRVFAAAATTLLVLMLAVCVARWLRPVELVFGIRILAADPEMPLAKAVGMAGDVFFKASRASVILALSLAVLVLHRRGLVRGVVLVLSLVGLSAADLASAHKDFNLSLDWSRLSLGNEPIDVAAASTRHERIFSYSAEVARGGAHARLKDTPNRFPKTKEMADWMVAGWDRLMVNATMPRGVSSPLGGAGIVRQDSLLLRDTLAMLPADRGAALLAPYSVKYLLGLEPLSSENLRRVGAERPDGIRAYEVTNAAARAYLAGTLRSASKAIDTFNHLIDRDFRIGREAVVESVPEGWRNAAPEEAVGSAEIITSEPELVTIAVRAERPALLVLNDTFYPGWIARIDGDPAEIVRTNQIVRGVFVERGEHRVTFSYEPRSFRIGLWISAIAWLVLAGIAISAWTARGSERR